MVTISSKYLPQDVPVFSCDDLIHIASLLISLADAIHVERGGIALKPLISIEFVTPKYISRVTFCSGVKLDDVINTIPVDANYELLNNLSNGKEK